MSATSSKPTVLHLGDPIKYNIDYYNTEILPHYNVVNVTEPDRASFIKAFKTKKYGSFSALLRPHFQSGNQMYPWDEELISLLPDSCLLFASAGAGYDGVDVQALGKRGIYYTNNPTSSAPAVSDTTLYLILSLFRNFPLAHLATQSPTASPETFTSTHRSLATISHNPANHILALVGFGPIAKMVARKARLGLDMKVHYHDIVRAPESVEKELQVTWHEDLEEMLGLADCVSLHCPLTPDTRYLIDAHRLAMMKKGARLINTARGGIVDEDALARALKAGWLGAAALDVHELEPRVSGELAGMRNVVLTPHVAGGAVETRVGFERVAMENVVLVVGVGGERKGEPVAGSGVNERVVREWLKRNGD